jgi:hypothetical protein
MFVQDVVVEEERPEPERGTHFRRGAEPKETRRPSGPKEEEVRLVVSILAVGFGVLRWFLDVRRRIADGKPWLFVRQVWVERAKILVDATNLPTISRSISDR